MTLELSAAAVVIALGLFQVLLQAGEYRRVHGVRYANTAQDAPSGKADSPVLGRLTRALRNLNETLPFFLGIVLILAVAGVSSPVTQISAIVFAAARLLYLPLYAFGVPNLRGLVWSISFGALGALVATALMQIDWRVFAAIGQSAG